MGLYENIKRIAGERGMTIEELERKAEVSENDIYRWKKTSPAYSKVVRVADVLEVSLDEICETKWWKGLQQRRTPCQQKN